MCRINEEMCNEARMEGRMEGEKGKSIKIAQQLISMGMRIEDSSNQERNELPHRCNSSIPLANMV